MSYSPKPTLVIICGLPASGKTTTAKKLEKSLAAIRLCPDEVKADRGIDFFDEVARVEVEKELWSNGREALQQGQNVILEFGLWAREERDEKRLEAIELGVNVDFIYLVVPLDELWQRLQHRNLHGGYGTVPISRAELESYWQRFEPPTTDEIAEFAKLRDHGRQFER